MIDAPEGSAEWLQERLKKQGARLKTLILTHGHFDHIADAAEIKKATDCRVLFHLADREMIETPSIQALFGAPLVPAVKADGYLTEGETLEVAGRHYRILHTPGHCPGNICLVDEKDRCVYVGDLIFYGSVGRTDLPGGSFEVLLENIQHKIFKLPEDYSLYSGHGPATTVGREKRQNPFVMALPEDEEPQRQ